MTTTHAQYPADFAQRLYTIRRHLDGITRALDVLEREMLQRQGAQSEGEAAAQQAREVIYQQRPREVKTIR